MATGLSTLEQYFQAASQKALETLSSTYGVEYVVYRADSEDPYTVYGADPMEADYSQYSTGKGILVPIYGFVDYSLEQAGDVEELYLYTTDSLEPGDVIEVTRTDGAAKRYRIYSKEAIGLTSPVVTRYRVRPLID